MCESVHSAFCPFVGIEHGGDGKESWVLSDGSPVRATQRDGFTAEKDHDGHTTAGDGNCAQVSPLHAILRTLVHLAGFCVLHQTTSIWVFPQRHTIQPHQRQWQLRCRHRHTQSSHIIDFNSSGVSTSFYMANNFIVFHSHYFVSIMFPTHYIDAENAKAKHNSAPF